MTSSRRRGRDAAEGEPKPEKKRRGGRRPPRAAIPPIQDILKKGQDLIVQVTKEPISTKGPRVTAQVSLAGRFLVLMPFASRVGVSRKIGDRADTLAAPRNGAEGGAEGCGRRHRAHGERRHDVRSLRPRTDDAAESVEAHQEEDELRSRAVRAAPRNESHARPHPRRVQREGRLADRGLEAGPQRDHRISQRRRARSLSSA